MSFRRETPIALVRGLVRGYERYGLDPRPALRKAQIEPELLNDPQVRVTSRQIEVFAATAALELNDEGFGMYSVRLPVGTFEMLTRACASADTLAEALQRWCRFRRLVLPDISTELQSAGSVTSVVVHEHRALGAARDLALLSVLRHVHGLVCWLIDSRLPLTEVTFPGPPPGHQAAYALMFPGPVRFDASRAALRFSTAYLGLPVRRSEQALRHFVQDTVQPMIKQFRRDRLLLQGVRALLLAHLAQGLTAEQVAQRMNLSVRTLHRQLAFEGATLQALKDQARLQRALDLLARRHLPIKRVASQLGFVNEKSFGRAFARWTGQSPTAWRAAAKFEALKPGGANVP